ncbi:hypothetical protein [Corticibacter populi]|nr:hypothetical protein [Corticibacter populi]RZS31934.1 hypothetical protein EV687_2614 [Corticibacter populi]
MLVATLGLAASAAAETAPAIQPEDGRWGWTAGTARSSAGCMPGMAETLLQLLPQQKTGLVTFERPFHPRDIIDHPAVQWQQRGPNHFVAVARGASLASFPLPLDVEYHLRVQSPTHLHADGTVALGFPQPCSVSAPFEFRRQAGPAAPGR